MLVAGARNTASIQNHCLRSQLKAALRRLGCQTNPHNAFAATNLASRTFYTNTRKSSSHESGGDSSVSQPSVPIDGHYDTTLHLYPNGRVIKRAGRRQRETFQSLGIDSLGERSDVVILRDVESNQTDSDPAVEGASTYGEQNRVDIDGDNLPDDQDVFTSIEALRPSRVSLEKPDFDHLIKQLAHGYNKEQLRAYLSQSLPAAAEKDSTRRAKHAATMSIWRRGTTDLSHRLPLQARHSKRATLSSLADQIVRAVWGVSPDSELQEIGETEFTMPPAVFAFMAARYSEPLQWHALLPTAALARTVEVSFYAGKRVIRITGRRHDALDAAFALSSHLDAISTMVLTLANGPASKLVSKIATNSIEARTGTVIELRGNDISITGASLIDCYDAKRSLARALSVKQQEKSVTTRNVFTSQTRRTAAVLIPDLRQGIKTHKKYRETALQAGDHADFASLSRQSRHLEHVIENVTRLAQRVNTTTQSKLEQLGSINPDVQHEWKAVLGYAMSSRPQTDDKPSHNAHAAFTSYLPSLRHILRHFVPLDEQVRQNPFLYNDSTVSSKMLVAHFLPSPFGIARQDSDLPVLEVRFHVEPSVHRDGTYFLLRHLQTSWKVSSPRISIKLPDREIDLQLRRPASVPIDITTASKPAREDTVEGFIRRLQESRVASVSQAFSTLIPQHDIMVPAGAIGGNTSIESKIEHCYICSGLMFTEWHDFKPKSSGSHIAEAQLLAQWPTDVRLHVSHTSHSNQRSTITILSVCSDKVRQLSDTDSPQPDAFATLFPPKDAASDGMKSTIGRIVKGAVALADLSTAISRRLQFTSVPIRLRDSDLD